MKKISIVALCSALFVASANANWERHPAWYDDGTRMTVSLRGGFAMGSGRIQNELGNMVEGYYEDSLVTLTNPHPSGAIMSEAFCDLVFGGCEDFYPLGVVMLGDLPATKNFESSGFAGGMSVGFTIPGRPQWRLEADWLHISRTNFNSAPLFSGFPGTLDVDMNDDPVWIGSSAVRTSITNDVISAMIYYDFFEGQAKQAGAWIPYVGFGLGYANTATTLELTDLYGDLSLQPLLQHLGVMENYTREFFTSENVAGSIAGTLAVGAAYGLMDGLFLDFSLRLTYIPRVVYSLNNDADATALTSRTADIFSVDSLMYTTVLMGLRFEF